MSGTTGATSAATFWIRPLHESRVPHFCPVLAEVGILKPSHTASASGVTIAVSFDNTASEKQIAASQILSSRKKASAHSVPAAANKSACASELCAKNTG